MVRLRQIASAIAERKYQEIRNENLRASWSTRTVAAYIAAGYWIDSSKGNPALEAARVMSLDPGERELLEFKAANPSSSEDSQGPPKENPPGSFERFVSAMNPQRWAGGS